MATMDSKVEVCDFDLLTIPAADGSASLTSMGLTINPRARRISLMNVGSVNVHIRSDGTNAAATDFILPAGGVVNVNVSVTKSAQLRFFATNQCNLDVLQLGS